MWWNGGLPICLKNKKFKISLLLKSLALQLFILTPLDVLELLYLCLLLLTNKHNDTYYKVNRMLIKM